MHATTILTVRKGKDVVVIGDGQVSLGSTVVKPNARKVRVIGNGSVVCGFAGSTADCFALLDQLEKKVEEFPGQLLRAVVELVKMWRTDRMLRHLEAWVIVCDANQSITVTGSGDVLSEPNSGVMGIGSGGLYAVSAAKALVAADTPLSAREIAIHAMNIAADVCVYTNHEFVIEAFENGQLVKGPMKAEREEADRVLRERREKDKRAIQQEQHTQRQQEIMKGEEKSAEGQ